ncbi:MAG TPA: DNA-3-methyladenine glycosylase, partial [Vicinamibacteria bacterium]|nr:DNA-3-methyladenine glycosylase [Vicinamibacteria bacterium]
TYARPAPRVVMEDTRGLRLPSAAERRRLLAGLAQPPIPAARFLLGQVLVRRSGRSLLAVRIVETEAYLASEDPAAHAFRGRTPRTEPLWGPPGTLYVYFIYGMHHCLNVSVDLEGAPGCVLIRAAEPLPGSALPIDACRGPGRLCRALALDTRFSGRHLFDAATGLTLRQGDPPASVATSPRVGIRHAADRPLRFFDPRSPAVSAARPFSPRGRSR